MKAQNTEKFEMNLLTNGQETPITSDMIKATLHLTQIKQKPCH